MGLINARRQLAACSSEPCVEKPKASWVTEDPFQKDDPFSAIVDPFGGSDPFSLVTNDPFANQDPFSQDPFSTNNGWANTGNSFPDQVFPDRVSRFVMTLCLSRVPPFPLATWTISSATWAPVRLTIRCFVCSLLAYRHCRPCLGGLIAGLY